MSLYCKPSARPREISSRSTNINISRTAGILSHRTFKIKCYDWLSPGFAHDLRVAGKTRRMEGGLDQATLPPMHAVRARRQSIAECVSGAVKDRPGLIKDAVIEQNLADQLRRAHYNRFERTDLDTQQVAMAGQGGQKTQRVIQQ